MLESNNIAQFIVETKKFTVNHINNPKHKSEWGNINMSKRRPSEPSLPTTFVEAAQATGIDAGRLRAYGEHFHARGVDTRVLFAKVGGQEGWNAICLNEQRRASGMHADGAMA